MYVIKSKKIIIGMVNRIKKNVSKGSLNGFCYTLKWLDKDSGQSVKPENTDVLRLPL